MRIEGRAHTLEDTRGSSAGFVEEQSLPQLLGRLVGRGSTGPPAEVSRERSVARRLRRLPAEEWTIINDVSLHALDHNVDHLVVGPPGVFCLSTSDHRGKSVWVTEDSIRVNNFPVQHLSKARACRRAVHRDLSRALGRDIHVRTVVVVTTNDLSIRTQPLGGSVIEARRISSWLQARPRVLDPDERAAIAGVVLRPTTWMA